MTWQNARLPPPPPERLNETLAESLSRIAGLYPYAPALLSETTSISFRELSNLAETAAHTIRAHTAPPEPVATLQTLGPEVFATWFACGLAGKPLLLLDPRTPATRLLELLQHAGAGSVLIDKTTHPALPSHIHSFSLENSDTLPALVPLRPLHPREPALIFPTSGSTGQPKLVTHSASILQARIQASISVMNIQPGDRVLIASSHGNFGYLHHALSFLLAGASVCLCDIQRDGIQGMFNTLLSLNVRHLRVTPSIFRTLAHLPNTREAFQHLKALRFSGEPLLTADVKLARQLLPDTCRIQNIYGSTESALFVWSDTDGFDPDLPAIPIGQPYPLWRYRIRPLPEDNSGGTTGELITSSPWQAAGDWTPKEIDLARFPPNEETEHERLYATGDSVRQLPNGQLLLIGRVDQLVKIHGQRVSIPEVEQHLLALDGVHEATVIESPPRAGLTAFVNPGNAPLSPAEIRLALQQRLPDFMIPRQILLTGPLPQLPGGKVDRQAFLEQIPTPAPAAHKHPAHDEFNRLSEIWRQILKLTESNPADDFFTLGGDSLRLMELHARVENTFDSSVSITQFLADPTLHGLARILKISAPSRPAPRDRLSLRTLRHPGPLSDGHALIMPGWNGNAEIQPFVPLDVLSRYALSAVDIPIETGTLLQSDRWIHAALDIARRIQSETLPRPDLLLGFSIGGSIAWTVARLLSNTPFRPKQILLIDAPPLHKLARYRSPLLKQHLQIPLLAPMPPLLHIRRDTVPPEWLDRIGTASWSPEDGLTGEILMPTCEHVDFRKPGVISLANPALNILMQDPQNPRRIRIREQIKTHGGLIFAAVCGHITLSKEDARSIIRAFNPGTSMKKQCTLLGFLLKKGRAVDAATLTAKMAAAFPACVRRILSRHETAFRKIRNTNLHPQVPTISF